MKLNNFNKIILFGALLIGFISYVVHKYSSTKIVDRENKSKIVITLEELAKYDGIQYKNLYLSVIGSVFDVSSGAKHYAKGSSYNYFIGKDGSRALVSGNFKDESEEKDHVLDFKCDDLFALIHWRKTFRQKYKYIGVLEGRYFNSDGTETQYMSDFRNKIRDCKKEQATAKQQDQLYPPCNIEWTEAEGTKVWCSKSSGGITRNWIGFPRQYFAPGDNKPKCVCVQDQDSQKFKEYEGCPSMATECKIQVT